jgi:putative colanic acid biosynthesis UDP-glucose lipid carrier transferase
MSAYLLITGRKEGNRVLVVGAGEIGERIGTIARRWPGYQIKGYLDDDANKHGKAVRGVPVLGSCRDVKRVLAETPVSEVWITLPFRANHVIEEIINSVSDQPVTIRYFPDVHVFNLLNHSASSIAGYPVLVLNDSPLKDSNWLIKTIEDYSLSIIILAIISPLLLAIALTIYLTSGRPLLYKQKRHGAGGKPINVYKFRTMHQAQTGSGEVVQAARNDTRVTSFGKYLRRTSLDELPQFFNVLQGRMSIVGPRPHAVEHNEHYQKIIDRYMLRHKVKPGITGWAQVNGYRGETDTLEKMEKRVEYDLFYIQNWSVWFDLKIILLTVLKGFFHKNAY